jgi:hypothetical protein
MITEFTKPWDNNRVWFDSDEKTVVCKTYSNTAFPASQIYKFTEVHTVSTGEETIFISSKPNYEDTADILCCIKVDPQNVSETAHWLRKAFDELDKQNHPFLCPRCKYGQLFRIQHEPPHYGEPVYLCKDMSKRLEASLKYPVGKADLKITMPTLLDYEEGPGGWDGKTCPNYTEKENSSETFEIKRN